MDGSITTYRWLRGSDSSFGSLGSYSQSMVMTKPTLLRAIEEGRIFVSPFDESCVNSASIDVRLGRWFYRLDHDRPPFDSNQVLNPWNKSSVLSTWKGPFKAFTLEEWIKSTLGAVYDHRVAVSRGLPPETPVIILRPGEVILAHTEEFIGGADDRIVPSMQARSTIGRSNISVCSCAGWGDVAYHNRWTMEIQNRSLNNSVLLPVGFRIAQIVFEEGTEPTEKYQALSGKYQTGSGQEMIDQWQPQIMLPQAWKDRELSR